MEKKEKIEMKEEKVRNERKESLKWCKKGRNVILIEKERKKLRK